MGEHPLQRGAAYSKDEIMSGMKRPTSDEWTGLAASMWIRKALEEMPDDHVNRADLLGLLEANSSALPLPLASSLTNRKDSLVPRKDSVVHEALPTADRTMTSDHIPTTSGCSLSRIKFHDTVDLNAFDNLNTTHFDLRRKSGNQTFRRWMDECPDGTNLVHKICIQHWTWVYNEVDCVWSAIADETAFSLQPSGDIKITRRQDQDYPLSCDCDITDRCSKLWSVGDFAQALVHEDTPLIYFASKFVDLVHEHDKKFEDTSCLRCRMPMVYLRTYGERALVPQPLRLSCSPPPPVPPKAALRASRSTLSCYSSRSASPKTSRGFHQEAYDILNTADFNSGSVSPLLSPASNGSLSPLVSPTLNSSPALRIEIPTNPNFSTPETPIQSIPYSDCLSSPMTPWPSSYGYCSTPSLPASPTFKVETTTSPSTPRRFANRLSQRFSSINIKPIWASSQSSIVSAEVSTSPLLCRKDSCMDFPPSPKSSHSRMSLRGKLVAGLRRP